MDSTVRRLGWMVVWSLVVLFILALGFAAAVLFYRSGVLQGQRVTGAAAVWGFLGAALAATATLIAGLSTRQHQARAHALARREEERLGIETLTAVVRLIAEPTGQYAPKAVVAGALTAMLELQHSAAAVRMLGACWGEDAISDDNAVSLLSNVLEGYPASTNSSVVIEVCEALYDNAERLLPSKDQELQAWHRWPDCIEDAFHSYPREAKRFLLLAGVKVLFAREVGFWSRYASLFWLSLLQQAEDDEEVSADARYIGQCLREADVHTKLKISADDIPDGDLNFELEPFGPWLKSYILQNAEDSRWAGSA
jgi:hypothetical protein